MSWYKIEKFFKKQISRLMEQRTGKKTMLPKEVDFNSIRRILVVRQHDQLGDLLLSTPVFRALRERFPRAYIAVLVRKYTFDVVKHNAYINQVILFHEQGQNYTFRWLYQFFSQLFAGYDLTIVLNTVSHSLTSDILAYCSRARYILGSEHLKFAGTSRNFFYNLIAPYDEKIKNQTERNLDIVRYLSINTDHRAENMTLTPVEIYQAKEFLAKNGVTNHDLIIGVHPGAGKLANRWPVARFVELIRILHRKHRPRFVLSWGNKENDLGQKLIDGLDVDFMLATNLKLRQLAAILAQIHLFFCNDTGTMHLAAAVGTPLVAIFGPTDPQQWKPLGEKFIAIRHHSNRCEDVTVDEVMAAGEKLLKEYARPLTREF